MNYYLLGNTKLANSVLKQVMGKMFNTLESVDGDYCIGKWLYRLSIDSCLEMEGKKLIEERSNNIDTKNIIKTAITKLPFDQRTVLVLHDMEKLSYEDISEILELPLALVKTNLHKARLTIKEVLKFHKKNLRKAL